MRHICPSYKLWKTCIRSRWKISKNKSLILRIFQVFRPENSRQTFSKARMTQLYTWGWKAWRNQTSNTIQIQTTDLLNSSSGTKAKSRCKKLKRLTFKICLIPAQSGSEVTIRFALSGIKSRLRICIKRNTWFWSKMPHHRRSTDPNCVCTKATNSQFTTRCWPITNKTWIWLVVATRLLVKATLTPLQTTFMQQSKLIFNQRAWQSQTQVDLKMQTLLKNKRS